MNVCSKFNVKREGPQLKNSRHSDVPKWTKKAFLSINGLLQGGVNDRRVQKTQGLLRAALISLIAEKPYDSIAVREILDRANVRRSTFYMHFRDKDDLLVSGIYEMLVQFRNCDLVEKVVIAFSGSVFQFSSTTTGVRTPGGQNRHKRKSHSARAFATGARKDHRQFNETGIWRSLTEAASPNATGSRRRVCSFHIRSCAEAERRVLTAETQ
jgi:AcrR family transcriptional regulator